MKMFLIEKEIVNLNHLTAIRCETLEGKYCITSNFINTTRSYISYESQQERDEAFNRITLSIEALNDR